MIRMAVLGSGSAGNSALIQAGNTRLLIDAGLSARQLHMRMELLDIRVEQLDGILLTHEHSDHTRGVKVLLKDLDLPIFANSLTREYLKAKFQRLNWKVFENGTEFEVGDFKITAFPVPHDAQEPVGYRLESAYGNVGVLTDVGYVTHVVRSSLKELDGLFLEANYDCKLLEADSKRPWSIKQRISSRHGHLSNEQAAELYTDIACQRLQSVIVGHLSSDCNTRQHVTECFTKECQKKGVNMPRTFICAEQGSPTDWLKFGKQSLPSAMTCGEGGQGQLF